VQASVRQTKTPGRAASLKKQNQGSKLGRISEKEKEKRIDHLLEVTKKIFIEEGYEAVTTRRIAKAAGVSIKSIYSWFPDKLALFIEVMTRVDRGLRTSGDAISFEDLSLEEALFRQAQSMIDAALQPMAVALTKFLQREAYKHPEFRSFVREQNLAGNIAQIRGIFEEKLVPKRSASEIQELSMMFFYQTVGELSRSIAHDLDLPNSARVDQYARQVARIFTSGSIRSFSEPSPTKKTNSSR
jgi:AcrR family transcriptional regulator